MSTNHSVANAVVFAHCSHRQRERLDSLATSVQVKAGKTLAREGEIGLEFGVITEGTATVSVAGRKVATLTAGDHYGEVALLDHIGHDDPAAGRRMATVTADTDLWVSVMTVREFATLLADFPDVADAVRRSARDRAGSAQG